MKHRFFNFFRCDAHRFCKNTGTKGTAETAHFLEAKTGNDFAPPFAIIIIIRRESCFRAFSGMTDCVDRINMKFVKQEPAR